MTMNGSGIVFYVFIKYFHTTSTCIYTFDKLLSFSGGGLLFGQTLSFRKPLSWKMKRTQKKSKLELFVKSKLELFVDFKLIFFYFQCRLFQHALSFVRWQQWQNLSPSQIQSPRFVQMERAKTLLKPTLCHVVPWMYRRHGNRDHRLSFISIHNTELIVA